MQLEFFMVQNLDYIFKPISTNQNWFIAMTHIQWGTCSNIPWNIPLNIILVHIYNSIHIKHTKLYNEAQI